MEYGDHHHVAFFLAFFSLVTTEFRRGVQGYNTYVRGSANISSVTYDANV
jgi:hypothetical protein